MGSEGPAGFEPLLRQRLDALVRSVPPFVGRRPQRAWLEEHLRLAADGRPGLVLLSGEAGLGKTRLASELERLAHEARLFTCRGRASEDAALPFLPFVEVLRDQLNDVPEAVGRALGEDADRIAAVARVEALPGVRGEEPSTAASRAGGSELFASVSRFTIELARIRPTLLILDDLHWADGPTLEQLLHLVFAVSDEAAREPLPLLVVATHRPTAPGSRLERALARCRREAVCHGLELPELSEVEVRELLLSLGVDRPAHQLLRSVYRTTRGNPLFVPPAPPHLVRHRALRERGGYQASASAVDELALPTDLLEAIAARTRRADDSCRWTLALAACLGDRFSLRDLAAAADAPEEELARALEQGRRHDLLAEQHGLLEFQHPLVRHVLYTEPSRTRRRQMHRRIAEALEARSEGCRAERLIEIAHHLVRAGPAADPETLLRYARPAAEQAFQRLAWEEAAHFFEAAARAADALGRMPAEQVGELHFCAGLAHYRNMDVGPCLDHFERAIACHRRAGDVRGLARVLAERTRAQFTLAAVPYGTLPDIAPLEEVLPELGDDEAALRGRVTVMLAEAYWHASQPEQAERLARNALEIGRKLGDDRLCAQACSSSLALSLAQRLRLEEALEQLELGLFYARRSGDAWVQGWPLQRLPIVLASLGRLAEAERVARQACELSRETRDFGELSLALSALAFVAVARGEFERAEAYAEESMTMARRSHYPWGGVFSLTALASTHAMTGDFAAARRALDLLVEPGSVFEQTGPLIQLLGRVYRELLQAESAPADLPQDLAIRGLAASPRPNPNLHRLALLCAGVETAEALGDTELAARCEDLLAGAPEQGVVFANIWGFLVPRILGVAASLREDWDRAEGWFEQALEAAAPAGARPERGRTLVDFARMLAARGDSGDQSRAAALLREAGPILDELDMQPALDRAERLAAKLGIRIPRGLPKDRAARARSDTLVLLLTDMEGFTPLIERLGDERAQSVMRTHNVILRACLREHRGREIQHTGDGIMATFSSAAGALRCAVDVQRDLTHHNERCPDEPIHVRIGLHAGRPRTEEKRLFGASVNATSRVCGLANPGQIVISDDVCRQLAPDEFRLRDRGLAFLKGFVRPFRLHEVRWRD